MESILVTIGCNEWGYEAYLIPIDIVNNDDLELFELCSDWKKQEHLYPDSYYGNKYYNIVDKTLEKYQHYVVTDIRRSLKLNNCNIVAVYAIQY